MADYRVVDIEKLETDLTEMADEVRVLAGTTEKMSMDKMTESVSQANESVEVQTSIISQIKTVLRGKVASEKEEQDKSLDVTENGSYTLLPDEGKVLASATVNVAVPIKEEQEKTVEITKNGSYEVIPEENKVLSKVNVEVDVAFDGDIGKPFIDTSKIANFSYFCRNDRMNEYIDKLDTSNGTDFSYMFYYCSGLKTLPSLDTSKGVNFASMFEDCSTLTAIPQLDTSNGTNFSRMFSYCSALKKVTQLDTSKATVMNSLFNTCTNLTEVSQLFTGNCSDLSYLFSDCMKLKQIPPLDTSKCTNFRNMFAKCYVLTEVPPLDTSNGTNFAYMFSSCTALKTVSITTAKSNLSTDTFASVTQLENLTIGEGWNVNIYVNACLALTVESLHGMIENLADLTGKTAKTFQIGATNLAKIDEAHLTMLQNKNWNYS